MKNHKGTSQRRWLGPTWVHVALAVLMLLTSSAPLSSVWAQDSAPTQTSRMLFLPTVGSGENPSEFTNGAVTSVVFSEAKQQAALAYWTRERDTAAEPMELLVDEGSPDRDATFGPIALGPYGATAPGLPAADADLVAQGVYDLDWAAIGEALGGQIMAIEEPTAVDGTSQVYTSYTVNTIAALQTLFPHRAIGRLSFTTPAGTRYCSATSISNNNMLTAAHCLYDTPSRNQWYTNIVFRPAYRNGTSPYGAFPTSQCWVLTAWVNLSGSYSINGWARHDVGVCRMGRNSAGQTLNTAVGWLGREWNYSYIRHVHNMGYPFRDYNDVLLSSGAGAYLRTCIAESFQQTTETRGMGCNWGGGISGGPWIRGYQPNIVTGWATTVNSGIFIGTQNIYGARFNSSNIVPLCTAAGC